MSSFMKDPNVSEIVEPEEEYSKGPRLDTDKVFKKKVKKRPIHGKVDTLSPVIEMPVEAPATEDHEQNIEEEYIEVDDEKEVKGVELEVRQVEDEIPDIPVAPAPAPAPAPLVKKKRKMSEKQLEALKRGREKSIATRKAKKNVRQSIVIPQQEPLPIVGTQQTMTGMSSRYVKKDELKEAMVEAISTYDGIRKTRKAEKQKKQKQTTEAEKLTATIQRSLNPSQDEYWASCFTVT